MSKKHRKNRGTTPNKAFIVRSLTVVAFTLAIAALPVAAKYFTAAVTGSDSVFIAQEGGPGGPPPGGPAGPPPGGDSGGAPPPPPPPPPAGNPGGQPPAGDPGGQPPHGGGQHFDPQGGGSFPPHGGQPPHGGHFDSSQGGQFDHSFPGGQPPHGGSFDGNFKPHDGGHFDSSQGGFPGSDGTHQQGTHDFSNPVEGCSKAGGQWCADQSGNPESGWCSFSKPCSAGYDPSDTKPHSSGDHDGQYDDRPADGPYKDGPADDRYNDGQYDDRYDEDYDGEGRHDGRFDDHDGDGFYCDVLGHEVDDPKECFEADREHFGGPNPKFFNNDDFGGNFPGHRPGQFKDFDFGFGHQGGEDGPRDFKDFRGVDFNNVDFDQYKDAGFGDFDYKKQFDQFKFNIDDHNVDFDREKENVGQKVREMKREGEDALRDIKNFEREVARAVKRSAGLEACPPIATAKAAIASAKAAAELMANASESTIEQAIAAAQELGFGHGGGHHGGPHFGPGGPGGFGPNFGPDQAGYGTEVFHGGPQGPSQAGYGTEVFRGGPEGKGQGEYGTEVFKGSEFGANLFNAFSPIDAEDLLWDKVMRAVGKSHMCEGVTHFVKEVSRMKKHVNRELKRIDDAEVKAAIEKEVLAPLTDLEKDPYSKADFDNDYGDPMRDLFDSMEDLRWVFEDIMEEQRHKFEERGVCGTLEEIKGHLASEVGNVPEALMAEGQFIIGKGLEACAKGDIETARRAMGKLHELKDDFERYIDVEHEEGNSEKVAGFGKLDAKALLKDAISAEGVDLEKLESLILDKMNRAIEAAVDQATQQFVAKIAAMESKMFEAVSGKVAAATDNLSIAFQGADETTKKKKEALVAAKSKVTEATAGLDKVVNKIADKIDNDTKEKYQELVELTAKGNFTSQGATAAQKQIDAALNAVSVAKDDTEAASTAKEEIATALQNVKAIYNADCKEANAFGDLCGKEDVWYAGYVTAANNEGILKGEDGNVNADRPTNFAEAFTMTARAVAGGADKVPTTVDKADPAITKLPEWAQAPATFLKNEKGVDVAGILGNLSADDGIPRVKMFELATDGFGLKAKDEASALARVSGDELFNTKQKAATAALVENGVVKGQGTTGNVDGAGKLDRAAYSKIMIEVKNAVK